MLVLEFIVVRRPLRTRVTFGLPATLPLNRKRLIAAASKQAARAKAVQTS